MSLEVYEVAHPYWDIKEFMAIDAQQAAEDAAEDHNMDEYYMREDELETFAVRRKGCLTWQYFGVNAVPTINYYGSAIEKPVNDREWSTFPEDLDAEEETGHD
jgi:hypothetical protein